MTSILFYGLMCALAPWLLAGLYLVLGGLARPLIYLLAAAQILIVPVLVALDPDISFGSDAYSLGAGVGIMLITATEFVFVLGTVLGVLASTSYITREERAAEAAKAAEMFSAAPAELLSATPAEMFRAEPAAMPELEASVVAEPARSASTEPASSATAVRHQRQRAAELHHGRASASTFWEHTCVS